MTAADTMTTWHARSEDDVLHAIRDAIAARTPLRVQGARTWHGAGAPVHGQHTLSLQGLSGIIAYVPGDLTLTAFAGTSLAELAHATAAHGQWLGLDPAGDRMGTIGATVATASAGPLAHAYGTPRDLVLGLDAVTGYGERVKPGGRVVKNVAGFDLVRLYTGSWGTLGPITSVTVRLRALPVHDQTLAIPATDPARLPALFDGLRSHALSLLACEWIDGHTAQAIGAGLPTDAVLVRIAGNDAFVRGQRAALESLGSCAPVDPAVWGALARCDAHATAVVRVSGTVSGLPQRITRLRDALRAATGQVSLHATVSRGVVRIVVTGDAEAARAALQSTADAEQRIVERLPIAWWATEADPFRGGLAGRIRDAFDPHALCNRRVTIDA